MEPPRPYFEVYPSWKLLRRQRWYWRLVAGNGEIVAVSAEAFASKSNALRACEDARVIASRAIDIRQGEGTPA